MIALRCCYAPTRASILALAVLVSAGCGTTNSRKATEQLLVSDAVDRSVAQIDFHALAGQSVYFDTRYINNVKGTEFVNADYIISSLRQQMFAAGCQLQDNYQDADYIVEARVGTLGMDGHELNFGIPQNNLVNTATSLLPSAPNVPVLPEISFAKKNDQLGAAKIGVFAYHRETKLPVWQSGIVTSRSHAKDTWVLGAGPFQSGTIYKSPRFAGSKIEFPLWSASGEQREQPEVPYHAEVHFPRPLSPDAEPQISVAGYEEEVEESDAPEPGIKDAEKKDENGE